jgi:hypothetical protein
MESKEFNIEMLRHTKYGYTVIAEKGKYGKDDAEFVLVARGIAIMQPVPENEQQLEEIEKLCLQKVKLQADTEVQIEKIEERIQSLLSIGHDGSAE